MGPHADYMAAVRAAIKQAIDDSGRSAASIAVAIGEKQQTVSKWIKGQTRPAIDDLPKLEEELGLPRGWLLVTAGLVSPTANVPDMVALDPSLTPTQRKVVLRTYVGAVEDSTEERAKRSGSRSK